MTKPDYTALTFPPAPPGRPYTILNMVMSADGKVVIEGTPDGLGSEVDFRLMRELRLHADVVLNGAETLRRTGASPRLGFADLDLLRKARGKPASPIAATVSRSGRVPLDRLFFTADDFRAVVYLSTDASAENRRAIAATGREVVDLPSAEEFPAMLRHMRNELSAELLLLETGPDPNAQLFELDAIDELFLTVTPAIVGGADTLTPVGGTALSREAVMRMRLIAAVPNEESGEIYLRYAVRRRGDTVAAS
jgi:2,5-diamino-6-(ribosylamino)-4(3H)-pyrimidinone 5'-phosphate reductase